MPPQTGVTEDQLICRSILSDSVWGWGQLSLPPSLLPHPSPFPYLYSFLSSLSLHFQSSCSVPGVSLGTKDTMIIDLISVPKEFKSDREDRQAHMVRDLARWSEGHPAQPGGKRGLLWEGHLI